MAMERVSKVYLIKVSESDGLDLVREKLGLILAESKALDFLKPNDKAAVKLHFGEEGNTGFVNPLFLNKICQEIKNKKAGCFLSDTNTLYRGKRMNSKEHLELAYSHGFKPEITGAEVIIPDDLKKENVLEVSLKQEFIKLAKIARIFLEQDALVGVAHFKGHIMTGFGGALKNIGMGCASREGKLAQHSHIAPFVIMRNCAGCAACEAACPVKAIIIKDKKANIDISKCIGCASCIAVCKYYAIDIPWEQGGINIQERMVEYAKAVLDKYKGRTAFINFAVKITQECDCLAKDDPRISPDLGILVSDDPVSLDKASLDLIIKLNKRDIFKEAHPKRDGLKQLQYAAKLGLGNLDYQLIEKGQG